jgi:hypothetical protein
MHPAFAAIRAFFGRQELPPDQDFIDLSLYYSRHTFPADLKAISLSPII